MQTQDSYLDYLINPIFQGVNTPFVLEQVSWDKHHFISSRLNKGLQSYDLWKKLI